MLLSVLGALAYACGDNQNAATPVSSDSASVDERADAGRSLDPTTFDRSCAVDSDCTLVETFVECSSCCNGSVAVRNTPEVQTALAGLYQGCAVLTTCTMFCGDRAVCVSGSCEKMGPRAATDGGGIDDGGADGSAPWDGGSSTVDGG